MISIDELIQYSEMVANAAKVEADKNIMEPEKTEEDGVLRLYDDIDYLMNINTYDRYHQIAEYLKELKAFRESERTGGSIEILVNNELSDSDKRKSDIEFAEDLRLLAEKYNVIVVSHQIADTKMRRCKGCGNYTASDFCPKCGTRMEE